MSDADVCTIAILALAALALTFFIAWRWSIADTAEAKRRELRDDAIRGRDKWWAAVIADREQSDPTLKQYGEQYAMQCFIHACWNVNRFSE